MLVLHLYLLPPAEELIQPRLCVTGEQLQGLEVAGLLCPRGGGGGRGVLHRRHHGLGRVVGGGCNL